MFPTHERDGIGLEGLCEIYGEPGEILTDVMNAMRPVIETLPISRSMVLHIKTIMLLFGRLCLWRDRAARDSKKEGS